MEIIFYISVLFTLIAPILIGINFDDPSTSWVAALCGGFVAFLAKIEGIAELSLGPLKAKMKQEIEEANATAEQLKSIATVSAEGFLTDLMASNYLGGMSKIKKFELHDKLIIALQKIGITAEEIQAIKKDWNKGVGIIYHSKIKTAIEGRTNSHEINRNAPQEALEASKELQALLNFSDWEAPTPHSMRTIVEKYKIQNEEVDSLISDYEHFLRTEEIRNKEEFLR